MHSCSTHCGPLLFSLCFEFSSVYRGLLYTTQKWTVGDLFVRRCSRILFPCILESLFAIQNLEGFGTVSFWLFVLLGFFFLCAGWWPWKRTSSYHNRLMAPRIINKQCCVVQRPRLALTTYPPRPATTFFALRKLVVIPDYLLRPRGGIL